MKMIQDYRTVSDAQGYKLIVTTTYVSSNKDVIDAVANKVDPITSEFDDTEVLKQFTNAS